MESKILTIKKINFNVNKFVLKNKAIIMIV